MVLDSNINKNIIKSDFEDEIKMSITTDETVLMMILSQNLYSDPIGSIIRELSSNALDAKVEACNDEPIIVSLGIDVTRKLWFKVQDFGTGISPYKMVNVISKFGESTKRQNINQLGFFGLGLKAPFAYSDIFFITTVVDNIEYHYSLSKGEVSPMINLLYEVSCDKPNGTIFSVPVKYDDKYTWVTKIKEQLCYFNDVYILIDDVHLQNNIVDYGLFKQSSISQSRNYHICLNNVYYPIDWNKLGRVSYNGDIGIKINISEGIVPLPNRESLKYTPEIIKLINDKIDNVNKYLFETYIKQRYIDVPVYRLGESINHNISELNITYNSNVNLSLSIKDFNPTRSLDLYKNMLINYMFESSLSYEFMYSITNSKVIYKGSRQYYDSVQIKNKRVILIPNDLDLTKYQKQYLTNNYSNHWLVKRVRPNLKVYKRFLQLSNSNKSLWREYIKEYQTFEKLLENTFSEFENIIPSNDELKEMYKTSSTRKNIDRSSKVEIKLNSPYKNNRGEISHNLVNKILVGSLFDRVKSSKRQIVFYNDSNIGNLFLGGKRVYGYYLNQTDYKKVGNLNLHYIKTMEEFTNKSNRAFVDMVMSAKVEKILENNTIIKSNLSIIKVVYPRFETLYTELIEFVNKNRSQRFNDSALKILEDYTNDNNLINLEVQVKLDEYNNICKEFDFLQFIRVENKYSNQIDKTSINFVKEVWVSRKLKSKVKIKNGEQIKQLEESTVSE